MSYSNILYLIFFSSRFRLKVYVRDDESNAVVVLEDPEVRKITKKQVYDVIMDQELVFYFLF